MTTASSFEFHRARCAGRERAASLPRRFRPRLIHIAIGCLGAAGCAQAQGLAPLQNQPQAPVPVAAAARASAAASGVVAASDVQVAAAAALDMVEVTGSSAAGSVRSTSTRIGKDRQDVRDIPQSITIVNRAVLDAQGAASLPDALRNVPGITLGGAEGGQIGNNINLRGFSARTDIFLDGVRDRGQYYRDTFFLDSVEVLKGPSSILFGRGSTGGVINQVSKRPQLHASNEVTATMDSNGTVRSTIDIDHPLSGTSAFRVGAMAQDAKTTRDSMHNNDIGVAPSIRFGIGTPTEVTLSALFAHNRDMPDYGVPPVNGRPADVSRDAFYGLTDDRTTQDVATASARIEHRFGPQLTLRNQTQLSNYTIDAQETGANRVGTYANGVFTSLTTNTAGNTTLLPSSQLSVLLGSHDRRIDDRSLYNQTDLIANVATGSVKHTLIAGVELGRDEYTNQGRSRINPAITGATGIAVVPLVDPPGSAAPGGVVTKEGNRVDASADTFAAYVNDTAQITPHWKLVGGLRWDRFEAELGNSVNRDNTAGNTALASAGQTVSFTSVRAGAIWQPTEMQSYYLSYGTSFNPSLEALTLTTGQQDLPPEKSRSYEAGAKWDLSKGDLSVNAAIFRIDKQNARTQVSTGVYQADGDVRVDGLEIGTAGRIGRNLQIIAGYTYLDAKVVRASALEATTGKTLANTPRHGFTLWGTYDLTPQWEVGVGANAMSSRYASNTDVVSAPGFVRYDATLAYHQPRYDIRLNVFNLADKSYIAGLIPSDGGRSIPGIGRTAQVTVAYRF
ncbi:MAG: TonB-dependent receptor [Caldimonas sp.]